MKIFVRLFCLAAATGTLAAVAQDNVIRTESRVVLVDAVVTDKKGNYVRDLKQKDFRVWEDNKEQTITSFTFEADAASPANDRKHYLVLFFDNSTSSPQDQFRAREAAVKFIDSNAGKNRLMAIVDFSGALRVTQNFTEDADRLKKVVSGVKFSSLSPANGPAVLRSFAARSVLMALRDLSKGLSTVQGRKTLVFISGGFPLTQDGYNDLTLAINACNQANVAVYPIDVRGLAAPNGASLTQPQNQPLLQLAAFQGRGGRNSNARNPNPSEGAVPMPASVGNKQVLYALASGTGGFVLTNSNDVLAGLEKIGKEQNEYYLLGYTPSKEFDPGACHAIKVKLDQGGLNVRARSNYCDVKPKDILAGTPTERDLENRAKGDAASTVKASMLAPFVYISSGTARVDMTIDIPPEALTFTKEKGKFHMAMNIIGVVHLPDGSVAARFSDTVKRDLDDKNQVEAFHRTPFHYEKEFEVAAGKYNLKVAFSSGGDNFGKLEAPLTIEAYNNSKFAMSGLVLSKDAHPATAETSSFMDDDRVPLIVNGVQITPAGSNHFSKAGRGFVYGELYEPALLAEDQKEPVAVGLQMQILERKTGAVKVDSGLIRLDPKPLPGNPSVPFALKLDFTNLAPGSYRVFIASGDSKANKAERFVDFELDQ
jgi:VWFA-related protein